MPRLPALLLAATALLACSKPAEEAQAAPTQSAAPEAPIPADAKRIDIAVKDDGFSPSNIDVKKGETVVLRFTRTTKSECLKAIAIPDLKIQKDLPLNTPVEVAITPQKEGKMTLQCWMAMVKATINVTP
ncbi:MAG: cupredoxin domain-containing protein [Polyangiaceae bacterium]|nr:cupredoxin domain-containing protein [Polyangiaceae bacterium]